MIMMMAMTEKIAYTICWPSSKVFVQERDVTQSKPKCIWHPPAPLMVVTMISHNDEDDLSLDLYQCFFVFKTIKKPKLHQIVR